MQEEERGKEEEARRRKLQEFHLLIKQSVRARVCVCWGEKGKSALKSGFNLSRPNHRLQGGFGSVRRCMRV